MIIPKAKWFLQDKISINQLWISSCIQKHFSSVNTFTYLEFTQRKNVFGLLQSTRTNLMKSSVTGKCHYHLSGT